MRNANSLTPCVEELEKIVDTKQERVEEKTSSERLQLLRTISS